MVSNDLFRELGDRPGHGRWRKRGKLEIYLPRGLLWRISKKRPLKTGEFRYDADKKKADNDLARKAILTNRVGQLFRKKRKTKGSCSYPE